MGGAAKDMFGNPTANASGLPSYLTTTVILLCIASRVSADCVEYGTEGLCKGVLPYYIYVPPDYSKDTLEHFVYTATEAFKPISFVDTDCYLDAITFTCLRIFTPCTNSSGVLVPTPVCKSVCEQANAKCEVFTKQLGWQFNCTSLPENEIYNRPEKECSLPSGSDIDYPVCPDPFRLARPPSGGPCQPTCIFNYYTEEQEVILRSISRDFSWVSFVASLLVIITYVLFPHKLEFPHQMILYLGIGSLGSSIGQLLDNIPSDQIYCLDEVTIADNTKGWCVFQGILLQYFPLTVAFWWLSISINLYVTVVLGHNNPEGYLLFYNVMAWGFPGLLVLIALPEQTYKYSYDGFEVCTLNSQELLDGLFIVWFMVVGALGFPLLVRVIFVLFNNFKSGINHRSSHIYLVAQIRTFMFLTYYAIVGVCLVSITYMARYLRSKSLEELEQYFACIYGFTGEDFSECSYDVVVPFSFTAFTKGIVFGQGMIVFLVFLTTRDTYMCYRGLFLYRTRNYKSYKSLLGVRNSTYMQTNTTRSVEEPCNPAVANESVHKI